MEKENKKTNLSSMRSWTGILLVALLLGGSLFLMIKQWNSSKEVTLETKSPTEITGKVNQPENGKIEQNPSKDLPSEDEVNIGTIESNESLLVPNPHVDNLIPEPNSTEENPQLVALKRALRIQNEIYFLMSRNFLDESDPKAKAQIENDLKTIQQKIDELQKAIDKLEKK